MKTFLRILGVAKNFKKSAIIGVLANAASIFFSLFTFLMLIPVLGVLFESNETHLQEIMDSKPSTFSLSSDYLSHYLDYLVAKSVLDNGKLNTLIIICGITVLGSLCYNLSRYMGAYFFAQVRNGVIRELRGKIFNKLVVLPLSFYSGEKKGDIISRTTSDVQEIEWSVMSSLESYFKEPIQIIVILVTLIVVSPTLTLVTFILLPLSGLIIARIGKSLKRTTERAQGQVGNIVTIIEETLTGLKIIKAFNAEDHVRDKFDKKNHSYSRLMISIYRKKDLASPLTEFLAITVVATVLLIGGYQVFNNGLDAKFFIGYLIVFSQLIPPAKGLSTGIYNLQRGGASLNRIDAILNSEEKIVDAKDAVTIKDVNEGVTFKNLSFKYENDYVLNNVSFTVPKGKTVALVGSSGSGKSTLADLLPRFYDVEEGEILIDGTNIKQIKLNALRDLMGIVTQDSILFNDTIYSNIVFNQKGVTKEQVKDAAIAANAHNFILEQENQYQTNIGDQGSKLSGGQRQRLSIARAILKNPPILILDEATSALDTESERLVQEALTHLMKNRTSLVIAHRLSTIKNADEILVLDHGKIIERGTHDTLIEKKGIYKNLYEMQSMS